MFKRSISRLLFGLAIITAYNAYANVTVRPYLATDEKSLKNLLLTKPLSHEFEEILEGLQEGFVIETSSGFKGIFGCSQDDIDDCEDDNTLGDKNTYLLRLDIIIDSELTTTNEGISELREAIIQLINLKKQDCDVGGIIWTPLYGSIYGAHIIGSLLEELNFFKNQWVVHHCAGGIDYILPFNEDGAHLAEELIGYQLS